MAGLAGRPYVMEDGSAGLDPLASLCSRGTLKWPDGQNHVGSFCQGLEHG